MLLAKRGPRMPILRYAIPRLAPAALPLAVSATVDRVSGVNAVSDDPTLTVRARRRERVDRALEAVERSRLALQGDLHALVV